MEKVYATLDGNEAIASVAYRINEVIAIYPITPASPMGEWADAWAAAGQENIWSSVPAVVELQSEGGAAGAIHGALQAGSLSTTFTASQGLLLMIPNMYKIAGELTPTVFHVAARSIACQALSIFGDHSDVMAVRETGFALLSSASVQEAHDFALLSHAASLQSRIPFIHFMDGFRTSHEINKIELLSDEHLRAFMDDKRISEHRSRALTPDRPVLRGTAQNPDVFFQARETVNPFYETLPDILQNLMNQFADQVGRAYKIFEYHGHPQAKRVLILMGSGCETAHETIDYLLAQGEEVGILKVRLYRPFDGQRFVAALPPTTEAIAVLDRTKEPGSLGEPLYLDCLAALQENIQQQQAPFTKMPRIIGGRYGLSSKEFTPAMIKSVLDHLKQDKLKNHFTLGIQDDVTHTSLDYDPIFSIETSKTIKALFYGLGSDGTVGANKNSIKIIGGKAKHYAQGYFEYDSKKAGAVTISHLRFGDRPIRSTYLIDEANFLGCHQPIFLERFDMVKHLMANGTFLLNTPFGKSEIWQHLPRNFQKGLIEKKARFYVIDAHKVARESGMRGRINTVMQVCFFALCGVFEKEEAIAAIKESIVQTYGKKGSEIVEMNMKAIDRTLDNLFEVEVPTDLAAARGTEMPALISSEAPDFTQDVLAKIIGRQGDQLPVSMLPADGTFPTATSQWEKRNISLEIPVWDEDVCIQCGKCVIVCPHAVIRVKVYEPAHGEDSPPTFKAAPARDPQWKDLNCTIQVAPEDCTGCGICVDVCPARNKSETRLKAINMQPQPPLKDQEKDNWNYFLKIPEMDRRQIKTDNIRQQQVQQPLFEFSGACAGCGETPYIKLMTQLFGDRTLVANATGCSSIYGGNLPTTPWAKDEDGRGPAWSNSLFEDNAEFGLGMRISINQHHQMATGILEKLTHELGNELVQSIVTNPQKDEADIYEQRQNVLRLKEKLHNLNSAAAHRLMDLADYLVKKSVWIVGGDGWGYDIGYGGLDHVLASGEDVNVLLLDTEVYSNTGGQMSKATPKGAVAKFASAGKRAPKKDLGLIAMTYGNIYVARVAMGAKDTHTLKSFLEAEAYQGPSLIIAYSHCIAHGINITTAMKNQKAAVDSGQWPLYRFHPEKTAQGENPLHLDSPAPKIPLENYMYLENRFKMLTKSQPKEAKQLLREAKEEVKARRHLYEYLAARPSQDKEQKS